MQWDPLRLGLAWAGAQAFTRADVDGVDGVNLPERDARRTCPLASDARLVDGVEEEMAGDTHGTILEAVKEADLPGVRPVVRDDLGRDAEAGVLVGFSDQVGVYIIVLFFQEIAVDRFALTALLLGVRVPRVADEGDVPHDRALADRRAVRNLVEVLEVVPVVWQAARPPEGDALFRGPLLERLERLVNVPQYFPIGK